MTTPLNELLSHALIGITRAYEALDPDAPSLPLLMVGVPNAPVSKRAAITIRKQVQKLGIDRERTRGLATLAEAEWSFASLRAPLVALVDKFELELPHYWITYGTADPTVTGGHYRPGNDGPPRIPPHGADWQPILRTRKGAAELPTTALLGQALCNFAIDYECLGPPLGWTIHGALPIDPKKGTPFDDVPPFAGLSGDGRSGLERHGIVKVEGAKPNQVARLTPLGRRIREAYTPYVARVEDRWRRVYGAAPVTRLRSALTKVAPVGPPHPFLHWIGELREVSIP